jgi:hypothetical protein
MTNGSFSEEDAFSGRNRSKSKRRVSFLNKLKFAVFVQSFGRHKEIEMLRLNVFGFSYDVLILGYSARLCF